MAAPLFHIIYAYHHVPCHMMLFFDILFGCYRNTLNENSLIVQSYKKCNVQVPTCSYVHFMYSSNAVSYSEHTLISAGGIRCFLRFADMGSCVREIGVTMMIDHCCISYAEFMLQYTDAVTEYYGASRDVHSSIFISRDDGASGDQNIRQSYIAPLLIIICIQVLIIIFNSTRIIYMPE